MFGSEAVADAQSVSWKYTAVPFRKDVRKNLAHGGHRSQAWERESSGSSNGSPRSATPKKQGKRQAKTRSNSGIFNDMMASLLAEEEPKKRNSLRDQGRRRPSASSSDRGRKSIVSRPSSLGSAEDESPISNHGQTTPKHGPPTAQAKWQKGVQLLLRSRRLSRDSPGPLELMLLANRTVGEEDLDQSMSPYQPSSPKSPF